MRVRGSGVMDFAQLKRSCTRELRDDWVPPRGPPPTPHCGKCGGLGRYRCACNEPYCSRECQLAG